MGTQWPNSSNTKLRASEVTVNVNVNHGPAAANHKSWIPLGGIGRVKLRRKIGTDFTKPRAQAGVYARENMQHDRT